MSKAGFYLNRTTDPDIEKITTDDGSVVTPDATGNVNISGDTIVTTGAGDTVTLETTEGISNPITGFYAWDGGAPYYDDTTLGDFTVSQSGTGYIHGVEVAWTAPQTVTGLVAGTLYFIYVDGTGTVQKTSTFSESLYKDNIILFECLRDSTPVTNNQITVKENHPYDFQPAISIYNHRVIGPVIENINNGANITVNGTQKIEIVGTDYLSDHGLRTTIPDSGGVAETWNKVYTTAGGKWALHNTNDTFAGVYNNAGVVTALGVNKYGVYRLYVSKDDLNSTTPTYFAVIHTAQFNNQALAETAISNDTIAVATNEIEGLEIAQLGYIIFEESSTSIVEVIIEKETIRSVFTGGTSTVANLITTNTANFDHILSAADTTVQAALETIDDLILRADGPTDAQASSGVFTIAGGSNIGTTAAGSTVTVNLDNSPSVSGSVTAGTGFSATTGNVSIVAGNLNLPTTTATAGIININSTRFLHSYGTRNTFVGSGCGNLTNTATANCGFGSLNCMSSITSAVSNCAFGDGCLEDLRSGLKNAAYGQSSLANLTTTSYNTTIGAETGQALLTGSNNILLGYRAGKLYTSNESSNIIIACAETGPEAVGEDNVIRIGTQGAGAGQQDACYIAGITGTATGTTTEVVQVDSTGKLGAVSATTINLSADATGSTVNLATGAAAKVVTVGSTNSASQLALQYGTADFTLASATGTVIQALDSGEVTKPLQPAFCAYLASDDLDVTGNGTEYLIGTNTALTERFDQGSDFNTNGIFTASVAGRYLLTGTVLVKGIAAATTSLLKIDTSNEVYGTNCGDPSTVVTSTGFVSMAISVLADMDASDTATLKVTFSGEVGDVNDLYGGTAAYTQFSGYLAC